MEIESACPEEEISDSTNCWSRVKKIKVFLTILAALWTPGKVETLIDIFL